MHTKIGQYERRVNYLSPMDIPFTVLITLMTLLYNFHTLENSDMYICQVIYSEALMKISVSFSIQMIMVKALKLAKKL